MNLYAILFYLLAAVMVTATVMAITRKNAVHAVIYLVISFLATALLFYLLGAPLLAALEVIIYAGAIMVLFLFIIMTLRIADRDFGGVRPRQWVFPAVLSLVLLLPAGGILLAGSAGAERLTALSASPLALGRYLFREYWFAVEVVSFLLFVGLVGALYLGRIPQKPELYNIGPRPGEEK